MSGKVSYESTKRYQERVYWRSTLVLPIGDKPIVQKHAKERGESVNAFIKRAIYETMERDKNRTDHG